MELIVIMLTYKVVRSRQINKKCSAERLARGELPRWCS